MQTPMSLKYETLEYGSKAWGWQLAFRVKSKGRMIVDQGLGVEVLVTCRRRRVRT